MSEPRFFADHGMIHDRVTGKHITADGITPGLTEESLKILNDLDEAHKRASEGWAQANRDNTQFLSDEQSNLELLEKRIKTLRDAMECIMPKVHQAYHEGEIEVCQKAVCVEYRRAMPIATAQQTVPQAERHEKE